MCTTCGCGHSEIRIEGSGHHHHHDHTHQETSRTLQLEHDLLAKNDAYAAENRAYFEDHGNLALNLVSSPGSGKTALLVKTIEMLDPSLKTYVVEGDQQTTNDADRIRATGAAAIQINTGKGCHLDAHMVGHAVEQLAPVVGAIIFIENVGNLVCPAGFDLGEAHKVVILSVTEGDDKPLKYPDMFAVADLVVINKVDLLPYVDFDMDMAIDHARRINPTIDVMNVSACTAEGMQDWIGWIKAAREMTLSSYRVGTAAE